MKVNDTDKKTSFWWIIALGLFLWITLGGCPDKPGDHPQPANVHTNPNPRESKHGR
jgi:hypothetical protein